MPSVLALGLGGACFASPLREFSCQRLQIALHGLIVALQQLVDHLLGRCAASAAVISACNWRKELAAVSKPLLLQRHRRLPQKVLDMGDVARARAPRARPNRRRGSPV